MPEFDESTSPKQDEFANDDFQEEDFDEDFDDDFEEDLNEWDAGDIELESPPSPDTDQGDAADE